MPQYTFKCPECEIEKTVTRPMVDYDKPLKCEICGAKMGRLLVFAGKSRGGNGYPMASYAVGIGACEVPAQMIIDKKAGVPTNYTKDGDPIFTSRGHRKKYLKHVGFHDRNSFDGN
jgi:putative FmdB family regulatory protein